MDGTHLFELRAHNSPSILARICLVMSRRRIVPARMTFNVEADSRLCTCEFSVDCDLATAQRLRAQLARVVELIEINSRPLAAVVRVPDEADAAA